MALVLALAACFSGAAAAQPSGAQAIHGAAVLTQQGGKLLVTTQNGAGSQHSAINWQSFSVPAGTTTHFAQPGASSTSINRVLGPDPSAIFGTLSSNGRLVLVNPAGIAIGAGAVVDTAGFTASTLRMSEADALAGRLRFGDGLGSSLRVDGQVLARSGDVVLIGTDVQAGSGALIQSPQGATILAAGQKVEVTGRGLEGIRFELQAGSDRAMNLGTLTGDAVGVFAGSLRHSGVIRADAATTEGGRVVLKATGMAESSGAIHAQGPAGNGGQVDVLGNTVGVLDGAVIDTSGGVGGGQIRIGGDYLGGNPAVPNAQVTYVAAGAQLRANATGSGDGGRIIVWSDDTSRVHGSIEATAAAGAGGFVETSGRRHLDVDGIRVQAGTWLLDPASITIVSAPAPTPAPSGAPAPSPDLNITSGPNYTHADSSANSILTSGTLNAALAGGTDVAVNASGEIRFDAAAAGAITLGRYAAGTRRLMLDAGTDIRFTGGTTTFEAGGDPSAQLLVEAVARAGSVLTESGATTAFQASTGQRASGIVRGGKTWRNQGTVQLNSNGYVQLHDGTGAATFANQATVNIAGGGGFIGGPPVNGVPPFGQVSNMAGATISVGPGPTAGLMDASVSNGGTISHAGDLQVAHLSQSGTTASTSGAGRLLVTHSLAVAGGTFDPKGALTVVQQAGNLDLGTGNAINATGPIILQALQGAVTLNRQVTTSADMDIGAAGAIQINADLTAKRLALLSGAGAIGQGSSAGAIRADELLLQTASNQAATLNNLNNQIKALAGSVGSLSLKAQGPLEVRSLVRPLGGTGQGHDGVYGHGSIDIEVTSGNLTLNSGGVRGADVTLKATGTRGAVHLLTVADADTGSLLIDAQGDVHVAGGARAVGATGSTLSAGGDITIGSGERGARLDGEAGLLTVDAAGSVTGGEQWNTLHGTGVKVVAGGSIVFGTPDVGGVSVISSGGGDVLIQADTASAASHIGGNIYVEALSASTSPPGAIKVEAGGSILVKSLTASAGGGDTGGTITVVGGGNVNVEYAESLGGSPESGVGGTGGTIDVTSKGGDAEVGYVYAWGGSGSSGGGTGGTVNVTSDTGTARVSGVVIADGGSSSAGAAGTGGTIRLVATAGMVLPGQLYARGGESDGGTAVGGHGGEIHVTGAVVGVPGEGSWQLIDASGGDGSSDPYGTRGGDGGTVVLTATSGSIHLEASSVRAEGGEGGEAGFGNHELVQGQTQGSTSGRGGDGGSVTLNGAGGVSTGWSTRISADGGKGGDHFGATVADRAGRGGDGGEVLVQGGAQSMLSGTLSARGGHGGDVQEHESASVSGDGGTGGSVNIALAGSVLLGSRLDAAGGHSGGVLQYYGESVTSASTQSQATEVPAPTDAPLDPARRGVRGAVGTVDLSAQRGAEVTSDAALSVAGAWTNRSSLSLGIGSVVDVEGALTNHGVLTMGAESHLGLHQIDAADQRMSGAGRLVNASSGIVQGVGFVQGDMDNAGKMIVGGSASPGAFHIVGNFSQQASASLEMDIAGPQAGADHDQLVVSGNTTLGGVLRVTPQPPRVLSGLAATRLADDGTTSQLLAAAPAPGAYLPAPGDTFTLLDAQGGVTSGSGFADIVAAPEYLPLLRVSNAGTQEAVPRVAAPTPAPSPAPTPGPTPGPSPAPSPAPTQAPSSAPSPAAAPAPKVDRIAAVLGDNVPQTLIARAVADEQSVLGTFLALLVQEEEAQSADRAKNRPTGDIVTDTQCR